MHDNGKCIDQLTVQEDIKLDCICLFVSAKLIIKRCISLCARFQFVKEVEDDFRKRNFIMEIDSCFIKIFHGLIYAAAVLHQFHDIADHV